MKTARHENLWGFEYGQRSAYESFTPQERTVVDFRLTLPESEKAHLKMQYGLPGIQESIVLSPYGEMKAKKYEEDRLEAIRLEISTMIRL